MSEGEIEIIRDFEQPHCISIDFRFTDDPDKKIRRMNFSLTVTEEHIENALRQAYERFRREKDPEIRSKRKDMLKRLKGKKIKPFG